MTTKLADILGSETLPAEMLSTLQEAFDAKIEENNKRALAEAETSVRAEMAARFEHDKANLVEAMDRLLTDVVKESERNKAKELANLTEARSKLDESITSSKKLYAKKMREHVAVSSTFVTEQLKKSVTALNEKAKALSTKQAKLESAYAKLKTTMAEQQAVRIKKMDEFVVRSLTKELTEFRQDQLALNEARVALVKEGKAKIKETQIKFISESAKKVEEKINAALKHEMKEMHDDIERNRQNTFGRRIFEAMSLEFMSGYLNEGTEISKLQTVLETKEKELEAIKAKLNESAKTIETASRKEKLAEDRAVRTKILGELLESLRGDKRKTMASLLESTKTEGLRAAYDRLLPVVLSEKTNKTIADRKPVISENRAPVRRTVEISGDQPTRIADTTPDNEMDADLGAILRLAGISK